jgi:hypothetical protein
MAPVSHGLVDERLHFLELLGGGQPAGRVENHLPEISVTDERGDIDRHSLFLKLGQIGPDVRPFLAGSPGLTAVADDHRGHSLSDHALRLGIDGQVKVGVIVNVDETRGDDKPLGVNETLSRGCAQISDPRDFAGVDADIRSKPRVAGPIDNPPVPDKKVEGFTRRFTLAAADGCEKHGQLATKPCLEESGSLHSRLLGESDMIRSTRRPSA